MVGKLGGIDQEAIGRYNNAIIDDEMDFADAFEKATTLDNGSFVKLNEETLALINNAKNAKVAENDLKEAVAKYGDAAQKASVASKALSIGMNILTTFAISAAIGLLSKGIEYVVNYSDHMADALQNSKSAVQENEQKISDLNSELETTADRLKELNELSGKRSLTPVEQEEVDNLRKYNDELERQISYEQARSRINQRTKNADFIKSVDAITGKQSGTIITFTPQKLNDEYNDYIKQQSAGGGLVSQGVTQAGRFEYDKSEVKRLTDERTNLVAETIRIQNEIDGILAKGEDKLSKEDSKNLNKLENSLLNLNYSINTVDKSITDRQSEMSEYVDSLIEAADGMEYFEGTSLTPDQQKQNALLDYIKDVQQQFIEIDNASSQAMSNFNAVFENVEFADQIEQLKILAQNGELTADVITSQFALMASRWAELGWTAEDVASQINSTFANSTQNVGITTSFDSLSSSLFSTTEAYKALTAAIDEQASAGVLSIETYQTLLEQIPELNDLLVMTSEGYALNTEAAYDYIEAQDEITKGNIIDSIQALESELVYLQGKEHDVSEELELQGQINQLKSLYATIEGTTGAYKRFAEAKKTANQDELHNEAVDAVSAVEEGLESGKIGTDDYKSGLSFILGKDFTNATTEQLVEAGREVEAFKDKYFSDNDKENVTNFADLLVGEGLASWDENTLNLSDTINVDEFAENVGMGKDAVISLFKLMEAYGAKLDWTQLLDLNNLTDAEIQALDKAQANNILPQVKENAEQANAAVADLQKQAEDGVEFTADNTPIEEAISEAEKKAEQASHTLEVVQEHAEGISEVDYSSMSLPELLEELTKLKGAIDDINANGLKPSVEMQGQYNELVSLVDEKLKEEHELDITANIDKATTTEQEFINNKQEKEIPFNTEQGEDNASAWLDELTKPRTVIITTIHGSSAPEIEVADTTTDLSEAEKLLEKGKRKLEKVEKLLANGNVDLAERQIGSVTSARIGENGEIGVIVTPMLASGGELDSDTFNKYIEDLTVDGDGKIKDPIGLVVSAENVGNMNPADAENYLTHKAEVINQTQELHYGNFTVDDNAGEDITKQVQEQVDNSNPVKIEQEVQPNPSHGTIPKNVKPTASEKQTVVAEVHADTSNVASEVESAVPDIKTNVDGNTGGLVAAVEKIQNEAEQPAIKPISADTSSASSSITSLENKAKKKVTKEVNVKITGAKALPYAKGTQNAAGGLSLVDEKGAELIEHTKSGTFELGTDNGARFTTLQKGDVVHTAQETKIILSRMAKIGGFFRDGLNKTKSIIGNAFATGVSGSMSWSLIEEITKAVTKKSGSSSSSKSSSSSSSAKKASKSWKTYVEKLFDWVEIRLERLQTVTDAWLLSAKQAIGYLAKNAELEGALSAVEDQIEATTKAYSKYMAQADAVAKKTGLSASIIKKIQEGTIEISSYSETTRDKISAYQTWLDKANALVDVLSDLRDQERELATEKLDNIIQSFQWRIDRLDAIVDQNNATLDLKAATGVRVEERDYQDAIDATAKKINELIASKKALTAEFSDMIARGYIQEGSEDWYNYTSELEELDKSIIEVQTDLQDLKDSMNNVTLTNLQYALSYLENSAATINDMMSLHDAQGTDSLETDYEKLIRNGMQQIKNLETQNAEILKQQSGLDVLSEKYKELQDQIENNNRSIMDIKVSQEEWNDAALDLKISELEKFRDELTKTNDKYEKQLELQQAIEDLQRASTQRTQRVFRDGGIGFQYEADQNAIQQAQEKFDQVLHNQTLDKIDEVIDSINDFKNDTNVYDINGNLLGQQYSLPNISDLSALMENVRSNNALSSVTEEAFRAAYNEVMRNITNGNTETNFSIGDIIVNGAETPDELAEAIVNDLPNAMVQALYKKLK